MRRFCESFSETPPSPTHLRQASSALHRAPETQRPASPRSSFHQYPRKLIPRNAAAESLLLLATIHSPPPTCIPLRSTAAAIKSHSPRSPLLTAAGRDRSVSTADEPGADRHDNQAERDSAFAGQKERGPVRRHTRAGVCYWRACAARSTFFNRLQRWPGWVKRPVAVSTVVVCRETVETTGRTCGVPCEGDRHYIPNLSESSRLATRLLMTSWAC